MSRGRGATMLRSRGGGTVAQVETVAGEEEQQQNRIMGRLTLRAAADTGVQAETEVGEASRRRIRWAEDVVDNEGLGRKSSKVCCIFHKTRPVGESSSESSSDSSSDDSDSDSDLDTGEARMANDHGLSNRNPRDRQRDLSCNHHGPQSDGPSEQGEHGDGTGGGDDNVSDNDSCGREPSNGGGSGKTDKPKRIRVHRRPRPNAYERVPKRHPKKE
ncbi:uncharacterized protein PADG_02375 [Paracoccidioides brasiliensis Pb18]|uniref:Type 1 phosphatases regulator n=1 Tax=Paracoccidioides brasiliensis (strain Pb18) TaxID=502780 RepID=C1G2K9_PARBD|nr:uncharacterized protein PADG_02375 [Paracoccidioides brasiliensis Pb18]EEH46225.1 hypothetical protein PADG_02375 [Paracoccidioides brasiliensis Pb18]ODH49655.1 hypothetical protein GX48_04179 [Paracoccidioides brasiliensis]